MMTTFTCKYISDERLRQLREIIAVLLVTQKSISTRSICEIAWEMDYYYWKDPNFDDHRYFLNLLWDENYIIRKTASRGSIPAVWVLTDLGRADIAHYMYQQGNHFFENKIWDQAVISFDKAVVAMDSLSLPFATDLFYHRGQCYVKLIAHEKALSDFSKAIDLGCQDPLVYMYRGECYYATLDDRKALDDLLTAYPHIPSEEKPWATFHIGCALLNLGEPAKALPHFTEFIKIDYSFDLGYKYRAKAYEKLGLYSQAIQDLEKAIQFSSGEKFNIVEYHFNLATLNYLLENFDQALYHINNAINLEPNSYKFSFQKIVILKSMEKYTEALDECELALSYCTPSKKEDIYYLRGSLKLLLSDWRGALKDYEDTLKLGWDCFDIYYGIGLAYQELGLYHEAIENFTRYLQSFTVIDRGIAYYRRGLCWRELGNVEQAEQDFLKAVSCEPKLRVHRKKIVALIAGFLALLGLLTIGMGLSLNYSGKPIPFA